VARYPVTRQYGSVANFLQKKSAGFFNVDYYHYELINTGFIGSTFVDIDLNLAYYSNFAV